MHSKRDNIEIMVNVGEHVPSGFVISTAPSFKSIENNHDVYRGKDCMEKVCKSLRARNEDK